MGKETKKIEKGDILKLIAIDDESNIVEEVVTHVSNEECNEEFFQIRTKNFGFDFLNFFKIEEVKKGKLSEKRLNNSTKWGSCGVLNKSFFPLDFYGHFKTK